MARRKNKILIHIEYWIWMLFVGIVKLLPLQICYIVADICSTLLYLLDFKHRNRVILHLQYAGVASDLKEAKCLTMANFKHFGRVIVEILKMKQYIRPENIHDYINLGGSQKAIDLFFTSEKPSQAIIITGHYGNWELAGMGYAILSGRGLMTVMRPFDNPKIGEYVYSQREGYNHRICPRDGAMKSLIKAIRKGDSVCIISDQHAGRHEGVETKFFGHAARTHASPAILHLKTGIPILVSVSKRVGKFKFEFISADPIVMEPTGDKEADIKKLTQMYTTALENLIKEDPVQWLWAHRRWLDMRKKTVRENTAALVPSDNKFNTSGVGISTSDFSEGKSKCKTDSK